MINMIKADLYRIFKNPAIYTGMAIMLLMLGFSLYMCEPGQISAGVTQTGAETPVNNEPDGAQSSENPDTAFTNPLDKLSMDEYVSMRMNISESREYILENADGYMLDRDILTKNANLYYVFIFAAVLAVTVDFSSGAAKNTLSSAISRRKYFISKIITIFIICLFFIFLNAYFDYFGNLFLNGGKLSSGLPEVTKTTFLQLPALLAFVSILTGLAFMVKKTAVMNMIAIPFAMVYQLLYALALRIFMLPDDRMKFEFQSMISNLAKNPKTEYVVQCCVICAAVSCAFLILGWLVFKKSEIK